MKKIKLNVEKLQLVKEKIVTLNSSTLHNIVGGAGDSIGYSIGIRCSTIECGLTYDVCEPSADCVTASGCSCVTCAPTACTW